VTLLVDALKLAFAAVADPDRAKGQRAYMKSEMPYHGIATPQMRAICRQIFKDYPLDSADAWEATVLELWRGAEHREERYAAIELLGYKPYRPFFTPERIHTLEELIASGAWWDYVDTIAINLVGHLLALHPEPIKPILQEWSIGEDIWLRRTAILSQLKFKDRTDAALLFEFIEPSIEDKEFFLRKAIGWALREYSKTEPDTVIEFIARNRGRLSRLSRREGLKVLRKQGVVSADDSRFQETSD
jgi:3-methyladenine DNA glycosylase AlkD